MNQQNGAAMKAIRTAKQIGVRELARRVGRSHGYISLLESERRSASAQVIEDIANAMGVPVGAITRSQP